MMFAVIARVSVRRIRSTSHERARDVSAPGLKDSIATTKQSRKTAFVIPAKVGIHIIFKYIRR